MCAEGSRQLSSCVFPLPGHRKHLDDCHGVYEPWGPGRLPQGKWPGPWRVEMTMLFLVPFPFGGTWNWHHSLKVPAGQADLVGHRAD